MVIDTTQNAKYSWLDMSFDTSYTTGKRTYSLDDRDFTATLSTAEYDSLIEIVNYINVPALKNNYAVTYTDGTTATLTITYNNGKTKTIKDYGMSGTYGLSLLYDRMTGLYDRLKWKRME